MFVGFGLDKIAGAAHVEFVKQAGVKPTISQQAESYRPRPPAPSLHPVSLVTGPLPDGQRVAPMSRKDEPAGQSLREAVIRKVENPQTYTVLSVPEAALYFEVKSRTIHRWTAEGKLKNGGRRGSITIESIRRFEKKRSRKRSSQ
jgi:hypothetical protein